MKREAYRHPKMFDLAARLGVSRAAAIGHVQLLLDYCADVAPQGNIGKWGDGAIARACEWSGDPEVFIESLAGAGWLDQCDEHRYVIHDIAEHAEQWWCRKMEKLKLKFLSASRKNSTEISAERSAEHSAEHSAECTAERSSSRDQTPSLQTPSNPTKPNQSPASPDDDVCQERSTVVDEFISTWNASPGVVRVRSMTDKRIKQLRARLSDSRWDWRAALEKFPLKCFADDPSGWKPDIDWILSPDSVNKILEGKYDWSKGNQRAGPLRSAPAGRSRSDEALDRIVAEMEAADETARI